MADSVSMDKILRAYLKQEQNLAPATDFALYLDTDGNIIFGPDASRHFWSMEDLDGNELLEFAIKYINEEWL